MMEIHQWAFQFGIKLDGHGNVLKRGLRGWGRGLGVGLPQSERGEVGEM